MTKIKNTKKGMAKKTLSVSLAVAMLATSNVPVWAAEFSDGVDAAFTSEAPVEVAAPVVEETVEAPVAEVAADYTLNTNMELKSTTWNEKVQMVKNSSTTDAAKFEITKNGVPVETSKITYEVYYNDDLQNTTKKPMFTVADKVDLTINNPGLTAYQQGGKVDIKFYVDGENEPVAIFTTQLQAVDISGATISYSTGWENYNGKIQAPKAADLTVRLNGSAVASDCYVVKFENSEEAQNYKAGGYKFAVEGVEEKGYTGTTGYTGTFTIGRVATNKDNLSVVVSGTATYNSDNTAPIVTVTDKLSGAIIPSELYTVSVSDKNVGTKDSTKVSVTMKESAKVGTDTTETYNNFKAGVVAPECITGSFEVTALDLSKLGDKYTVQVDPQEIGSATTLGWDKITLIDKSTGKAVDIEKILPTDKLTAVLTNNATAGKGRLTIKASTTTEQNIINEYITDVTVAANIISASDVALPAGTKITVSGKNYVLDSKTALNERWNDKNGTGLPSGVVTSEDLIKAALAESVYTGTALEPLKDVFESIVWAGATPSGTDMKFVLGRDYTLTYSENTNSRTVSDKDATVTLNFMGDYVGTISYPFAIQQATAYVTGENIPYTAGKSSYDANIKVVTKSGNTETAVPTTYYTVKTTEKARKIGDKAKANVVFTNPNYEISGSKAVNADKCAYVSDIESELVGKSLTDSTVTAAVEGIYTYTGKAINPTIVVKDGSTVLKEGTDYKVTSKTGTEAGDAYVTIQGINNYSGTLTLKYTIAKADIANATVVSSKGTGKENNYDQDYDTYAQAPDINTVKIGNVLLTEYNPITKTGDYEITWDEDAVEVGTYNFTITAMASSTKVQGTFKGTFKVVPYFLQGAFVKKSNLANTESVLPISATGAYYTGNPITIDNFKTKYVIVAKNENGENTTTVLTEGKDYRLEYTNNINAGKATVTAYGLGNYAATDDKGEAKVLAKQEFYIEGKGIIDSSWVKKISDVEYAGGLPVEPDVVIADTNGNRLVQGVDYTVTTAAIEIGNYKGDVVTIKGKGAYTAKDTANTGVTVANTLEWKVTKKDLKNTVISVDSEKNVTVMNGSVVVPSTEYTVAFSADGKKVTVTAKADSKNYTGSKEQDVDVATVGQAWISDVQVVGNKATVVLSGDVDNASGYDYVIATEDDLKSGRVDIVKNQIKTTADFQYVQKGTYYAYCHAWKRVDGKKVFGEWSNVFPFTVGATTPAQPVITSVKRSGSTVTVTYTKAANADGYDVVLGTKTAVVSGEKRPVNYGTLVKKNVKGDTVTVTFKDVPAGTYYAGLHAWNRTSLDNKKVFSPWSNIKTVTVK